ncbi:MAG: restriction endonuclease subunit S, partial [Proteobacteria bacterium]|nr:restriction endonuclease subunit S [Pseudomonadota bacterium]
YASLKDVTQSADLLGSIARVPAEVPLGRLTQDTVKLKLSADADRDLIYWTLRTPQYRAYCRAHATGTTNLGLSRDDFLAFPIPEPTADRLALVRLLEALEAKFKLDTYMIETLETIAREFFKSWFVDFDPVHAKEEGRPTGLSNEISDLFPSSFGEDRLPEGWSSEPVLDQAEWLNGAAYKDMHFSNAPDALPVIKIAELKNGITRTTKRTNTDLGDRYRIQTGELLFSWSGSPDTSIDTFVWVDGDAWLNQHIFAVRPNGNATRAYLFAMLKFLRNELIEIARNKQTTGLGHVTRRDLARLQVHTGGAAVLAAFETLVSPIYERIQATLKEMHTLPLLRDTLLSKLISGEMRIADAESQVSAA